MNRVKIKDLAEEIGVTGAKVLRTILGNGLPRFLDEVTETTADQIRLIYRNAAQPTQQPRPTPNHLREDYDRDERAALAQGWYTPNHPM